jgi:hypothetical protein
MESHWQIRKLNKLDDDIYESFLNADHSSVLGYHYPFYRDILQSCRIGEPYYVGLFKNESLVAVLPGFIKNTEAGSVYCSMPFFGPNAGIICHDIDLLAEAHRLLIQHVVDNSKSQPNPLTISFYTPFLFTHFQYYENNLTDYYLVEKETQYLDIASTEWDNKIKYDLRKAERSGLSISEEITKESVEEMIGIYYKNCQDYNIPSKPKEFIYALSEAALKSKEVEFYFAFREDRLIGGLIVIFSKTTLSYYLPCSLDSERTFQPVTYLIDYAFQKAKSRKIKYWNWESSPGSESGVYKFKKKWGSTDSKYRIYIKRLCDIKTIKDLGNEGIASNFPYFFVFPFNQINK